MGFSPGEFTTEEGEDLHIEAKAGGRIIFWKANELSRYFTLDEDNALKLLSHLETVLPK